MKKGLVFILPLAFSLLGTSCGGFVYGDREISVYRNNDGPDKTIKVRYYEDLKNLPFMKISEYMTEFLKVTPHVEPVNGGYTYTLDSGAFLNFNFYESSMITNDLTAFSSLSVNKDEEESKTFLRLDNVETTEKEARTISLAKYDLKIKDYDGEVYAPISLLSKLFGGLAMFDVSYNGENLYVYDMESTGEKERSPGYYETSYNSVLNNLFKGREEDTARYTYNELCFIFDNFKGETTRTIIDNDKMANGLDYALTTYYPEVKEFLLSTSKIKFYGGLFTLFLGLYDGGHTGILTDFFTLEASILLYMTKESFGALYDAAIQDITIRENIYNALKKAKKDSFGVESENYYFYNGGTQTAFLGFDSFDVDYKGWDAFYKKSSGIPVNSDSFAYIKDKFDQAKRDGAKNLILDLTTNGGGDTSALNGIVGLLNHAKSDMYFKDSFNNYFAREKYSIDLNLDGEYTDADALITDNYDFNVTIMTSPYSFSCGNYLPSRLKDLGFKTIGQTSGGGSCAVTFESTAEGISYVRSSHLTLFNEAGQNVDPGVPVDS